VLSAQFESFAAPFVIMLSVPLSMTGRAPDAVVFGGRSTSTARWASSRWSASSPSTGS
jgi:multidrug efflux pump subunit AcrB